MNPPTLSRGLWPVALTTIGTTHRLFHVSSCILTAHFLWVFLVSLLHNNFPFLSVGQKYLKGTGTMGACITRRCVWTVYNIGAVIMTYTACMDIARASSLTSMTSLWSDPWIPLYKATFYAKTVSSLLSNNSQNVSFWNNNDTRTKVIILVDYQSNEKINVRIRNW